MFIILTFFLGHAASAYPDEHSFSPRCPPNTPLLSNEFSFPDEKLNPRPACSLYFANKTENEINTIIKLGYRLIDLKVSDNTQAVKFSGTAVQNSGLNQKEWKWIAWIDQNSLGDLLNSHDYRLQILQPYYHNGILTNAAVLIKDTNRDWSWVINTSLDEINALASSKKMRVSDISAFSAPGNNSQLRYSAVLVDDKAASLETRILPGITASQLKAWLDEHVEWTVTDFESTVQGNYVAVVSKAQGVYSWFYDGLTASQLEHLQNRHFGRITNLRAYSGTNGENLFDATIIDNGMPVQGIKQVDLDQRLDPLIQKALRAFGIASGSIAVTDKSGKLVYMRAYGYSDVDQAAPATIETAYRVASLSKPITAMAMMKLIDEKETVPYTGEPLALQTRVFRDVIFPELKIQPPPLIPNDSNSERTFRNYQMLDTVTLSQVLSMTSGISAAETEPVSNMKAAYDFLGLNKDPTCPELTKYLLKNKLSSIMATPPGTHNEYANYGPCISATVLELMKPGTSYKEYVQSKLLEPLGINSTGIFPAAAILDQKTPLESVAYGAILAPLATASSLSPAVINKIMDPVYGMPIDFILPFGGWSASPSAYLKLMTAIEGLRGNILKKDSFLSFFRRPSPLPDNSSLHHYPGNGFNVDYRGHHDDEIPGPENSHIWHTGAGYGAGAWIVTHFNEYQWAFFYNTSPTPTRYAKRDYPNANINALGFAIADTVSILPRLNFGP